MNVKAVKSDPHFDSIGQASLDVVANTRRAMKAPDPYAYWREGLILGKGRELTREQQKLLGVHDGDPQAGCYRMRSKSGPDKPVLIGQVDGSMTAVVAGEESAASTIWTYCSRWPIETEQYEAVAERGEVWPDDGGNRGMGDNLPEDPHEAAKIEFEGEKEAAEEILRKPIKTQAEADRAAVAAKRLSDLFGKVDKLFRAEKDPIVVAGREVDEKFRWREEPKLLSVRLKRAQDDFLREQDRLEQERQRRAREEEARLQREADEKARKAAEAAKSASTEEAARVQREADDAAAAAAAKAREAEAQKVSAGRTGAKVSLRTFVDAQITDYDRLVMALKDRAEMKDLVQSLANRAAKAGVELAGMKIRSEKRAA